MWVIMLDHHLETHGEGYWPIVFDSPDRDKCEARNSYQDQDLQLLAKGSWESGGKDGDKSLRHVPSDRIDAGGVYELSGSGQ